MLLPLARAVRGGLSIERALTFVSAVYHLGAVIGPFLGGAVAEAYGLGNVYRIAAGIFLVSTALVLTTRKPPVEEHTETHKAQSPHLMKNPRFVGLLVMIALTMYAFTLMGDGLQDALNPTASKNA